MVIERMIEMDNSKCVVCGGELKNTFYLDADAYGIDWSRILKAEEKEESETFTLKRCVNCGLLYAKKR